MKLKSRRKRKLGILGFGAILLVAAGVFLGIQFFTKTGVFSTPGVVYYDASLDAKQKALLGEIFTDDVTLGKDVRISAWKSPTRPELIEGEYIYDITVPVADFYDERTDVSEFSMGEYTTISVNDLDFTQKLLTIDGEYYLDNFDKGANFWVIKFESEKFEDEIKPLVNDTFDKTWPDKTNVLSMAQTGVTALSRAMNAKLNSVGDATYFAQNIGEYLSGFDLTHTSNESSFTEAATADNICSDPRFINTLTAIGLDIVELTGNHNQDCGNEAALDTIDIYEKNNIKIVGGGRNADEAAKPLKISEKGMDITMFAYNLSTGGATYGNAPGANQYYEDVAAAEIAEAKARGDFVIVDVQYYECSAYDSATEDTTCDYADSSAGDQVEFFQHLRDLGADIVVGTSAHQPQTFEIYGDGAIYYGLGNLFFDQIWWPGTTRSLILEHYFYNGRLLQTRITPTVYDSTMQTALMDTEDVEWFIARLVKARP